MSCTKTTWRGVTVCAHMVPKLDALDQAFAAGYIQPIPGFGSYETNAASGNTGAGGGHVDIDLSAYSSTHCRQLETLARNQGILLAYWRTPVRGLWRQHCHILFPDCPSLSYAAEAQFPRLQRGSNNLVDANGNYTLPDTGDRSHVPQIIDAFNHRFSPKPTTAPAPAPEELPVDQNTFNGLLANGLVYSLRSAPTVVQELDARMTEVARRVWAYENAALTQKDAYAHLRGEDTTALGDVLAKLNDLTAAVAALKAEVDTLPKA